MPPVLLETTINFPPVILSGCALLLATGVEGPYNNIVRFPVILGIDVSQRLTAEG
jgi:hypothetical protein